MQRRPSACSASTGFTTRSCARCSSNGSRAQGRLYPELAEIRAANPGNRSGQFDQAAGRKSGRGAVCGGGGGMALAFRSGGPGGAGSGRGVSRPARVRREGRRRSTGRWRHTIRATRKSRSRWRSTSSGPIRATRPFWRGWATSWRTASCSRGPARTGSACRRRSRASRKRYLDAATVYWDYYRYNDALRWIAAARKKFDNPALFAYQAGAIYEGKRDYASAVREYVAGALMARAPRRTPPAAPARTGRRRATWWTGHHGGGRSQPILRGRRCRCASRCWKRSSGGRIWRHCCEARVDAEKSSAELDRVQETARRLGFDAHRGARRRAAGRHHQRSRRQDAADAGQRAAAGSEERHRGRGARGGCAVSRSPADSGRGARRGGFSRAQPAAGGGDRHAAGCVEARAGGSGRAVHARIGAHRHGSGRSSIGRARCWRAARTAIRSAPSI